MEALGILTVIGSVSKLAKSLHEIKDKYSNVALNTTLVASQLNVIGAALNALREWRANDPDQTAPAQQLDKDLGVSLSCCAILVSVIDGKLGESGYKPGLKEKIRHLWLDDILKEYISNLESQVRALQLLLTIFQCSSAAEQRQKLERADSRKIIEDVRAETVTLGVESLDIEDRASVYSDNPSVTFDVDSILMKTRAYRNVYDQDAKRKPLPDTPQPAKSQKKEKPPVPPRLPYRPGTKSQIPPVPPRPPPRRRGGAKAAEERENIEELGRSTANESPKSENDVEAQAPNQGSDEVEDNLPKDLENDIRQERTSRGIEPENNFSQQETKPEIIQETRPSEEQDLVDSSNAQAEDVTELSKALEIPQSTTLYQEDQLERTNQMPLNPQNRINIKCICGTEGDDGKLTQCKICDTWQHAECYYIDEFGIVPTNKDLECIEHYCAECAPRALHVEEAVERKTRQQAEANTNESRSFKPVSAEPPREPMKLELNKIPDFRHMVASSGVEDFTTEMENAFRGVQYLQPISQPVHMNSGLVEPSGDANPDKLQEETRKTARPPSLIEESTINEDTNEPGHETVETKESPSREPEDTSPIQNSAEPTVLDVKTSTDIEREDIPDAELLPTSTRSAHDTFEQITQEENRSEPPSMSNPAPSLTVTTHNEAQISTMNENSTSPPATAKASESRPNPTSIESKDEEDGLDKLIRKIRSSRNLSEDTTNANASSAENTRTQLKSIPSQPLGPGPDSTALPTGTPLKVDTGQQGRESFDSKSITAGTPPPPRRPPPLSPTAQLASRSAVVESVISTESSGRTSSAFDAASTASSEFPEVNTVFSSNQTAPTDATSLGITSTQTTRDRAQSDLRRLQSELATAKERGDSKAKEESIEKLRQVIWDSYLTPPSEDATSPKKSSSPRLGSRASFLRLPSLYGSTKIRTALGNAISENDEASIRKLLDEKANVNGRAEGGETPLMLAASLGHLQSMKLLKEHGADECASDAKGRTVLHIAVAYNHVSVVNWLLEEYPPTPKPPAERTSKLFRAADLARGSRAHKVLREIGDSEGSTALHVAADRGTVGMLEVLLTPGVDIEAKDNQGRTPLLRSVLSQRPGAFDILLRNGANVHAVDSKNMTALHFAAASDQVDIIKVLLSKGINKHANDHDGAQALHHAGRNGKISAITALITSQTDLNTPAKGGERLLHLATAHNHLPLAEHLLTSNADVNPFATPNPITIRSSRPMGTQLIPLHYACILGHLEMCILLLKHMAWVNAPSDTGMTALMMAADNEDTNLVNVLLEAGAKVNASVPGSCLTALHISARRGDLETVQQLCRAGANESARTSGSNSRDPIEEAFKYADGTKKVLVVEYLRLLRNNKLLAKRKNTLPSARSNSNASQSIRPAPGTPMAAPQNNVHQYPWHEPAGFAMNGVPGGPGASNMQGYGQFGMAPPPPPFYVPPQQSFQQYRQQQPPQQQQYFDPIGYEARFDTLPAYEPGPGAPARLAARPGVHRPTP